MVVVKEQRRLLWRNAISHYPVATATLELEPAEAWSPDRLTLAQSVVARVLPGFTPRRSGSPIADFLVSVVLAIQQRWDIAPPVAGMASDPATGAPILYWAYGDPDLAQAPGEEAVAIANLLLRSRDAIPKEIPSAIEQMEARLDRMALDETTRAIVRSAVDRGAVWTRLVSGRPLVAMGMGARRRTLRGTAFRDESATAHDLSNDRFATLHMLDTVGLPVGRCAQAFTVDQVVAAAERLGFPVALRSVYRGEGEYTVPCLADAAAVRQAAEQLAAKPSGVLLQSHLSGDGHRILVVDGHFVAATRRLSAQDVSASIHPDNARMAERAARRVGLREAGVDFITPDITRSWQEVGGGVCDVKASPNLRPHGTANRDCDVVTPNFDVLIPDGENGRIPTAMITGTNGKTTTTLMLAQILKAAGHTPGAATTDGVIIDGEWILEGDEAGSRGAEMVLSDSSVTAAALETARGGILRTGIALEHCDVAALLNVRREQIGIDGVETLEDMLQVKRKVTDGAEKAVVLNADDPLTRALMDDYPAERVIGFSMEAESPAVREVLARGSAALVARDGAQGEEIALLSARTDRRLLAVAELPSTMDGRHRVNIANAMAAAGLAHGLGIDLETIAAGLRAYRLPRPGEPGRMIWIKDRPYDVLIDYAVNPPSLHAVADTLSRLDFAGRRICVLSIPSNRPDWSFEEAGQAVARSFDLFICYDCPIFLRGRAPGDIATRLRAGLVSAGVPESQVLAIPEPEDAMRTAKEHLRPGDFLALLGGPTTYLIDLLSE